MPEDTSDQNSASTEKGPAANAGYQVLARKYRPTDFSSLIGQDAMVRTLTNAFDTGRIAHAFILTGVGVLEKQQRPELSPKPSTVSGPAAIDATIDPCGKCQFCTSIAEDRLVDVLEMDAASRTGVDDVRELIEGVRYKPVSARYKVYIIDEVHMLSRNAFNALLKTLEEPPEHVKFIFATTEIRKIPVTVLSRCQRFDLRRVEVATLSAHFTMIADKEGAKLTREAIALIARAADGSVRDGQSLLDQTIATGAGAEISDTDVRGILGLADRERSFDLLDLAMKGDASGALDMIGEDYANGADPVIVLRDLLEVVHWLTRVKVTPRSLMIWPTRERAHARQRLGQQAIYGQPQSRMANASERPARGANCAFSDSGCRNDTRPARLLERLAIAGGSREISAKRRRGTGTFWWTDCDARY